VLPEQNDKIIFKIPEHLIFIRLKKIGLVKIKIEPNGLLNGILGGYCKIIHG